MTAVLPLGQLLYRAETMTLKPGEVYSFSDKFEGALTYLTYKAPTRQSQATIGIYMVKQPVIVAREEGTYAYRREQTYPDQNQGERFQNHYYDYYYILTSDEVIRLGTAEVDLNTLYNIIPQLPTGLQSPIRRLS